MYYFQRNIEQNGAFNTASTEKCLQLTVYIHNNWQTESERRKTQTER